MCRAPSKRLEGGEVQRSWWPPNWIYTPNPKLNLCVIQELCYKNTAFNRHPHVTIAVVFLSSEENCSICDLVSEKGSMNILADTSDVVEIHT
jgi:hypothetical protein